MLFKIISKDTLFIAETNKQYFTIYNNFFNLLFKLRDPRTIAMFLLKDNVPAEYNNVVNC